VSVDLCGNAGPDSGVRLHRRFDVLEPLEAGYWCWPEAQKAGTLFSSLAMTTVSPAPPSIWALDTFWERVGDSVEPCFW